MTTVCWRGRATLAKMGVPWAIKKGWQGAGHPRFASVQLEVQRIGPIGERAEEVGDIGMVHRFA